MNVMLWQDTDLDSCVLWQDTDLDSCSVVAGY